MSSAPSNVGFQTLVAGASSGTVLFSAQQPAVPWGLDLQVMMTNPGGAVITAVFDQSTLTANGFTFYLSGPPLDNSLVLRYVINPGAMGPPGLSRAIWWRRWRVRDGGRIDLPDASPADVFLFWSLRAHRATSLWWPARRRAVWYSRLPWEGFRRLSPLGF